MRTIAWGIVLTLLWLPRSAAAQNCPPGNYEGFIVRSVSVETPLQFPIRWIERALLGRAIDSLDPVAQNLPLKEGQPFSGVKHTFSAKAISDSYTQPRASEPVKVAAVFPRFPSCDLAAGTVDVVYRVYSTEAAYFVSRLLDVPQDVPARELTIGKASETDGKILPVPFVSYNHESGLLGGASASLNKRGGIVNALNAVAAGSSSSYRTALSTGGRHDPGRGLFSHIEWNVGARFTKDPAAELTLRESVGKGDFFAATRAHGKFATIVRFGAAYEAGTVGTDVAPRLVTEAPKRSLKSYVGGTWSRNRQRWDASYGLEVGKGTDVTPVDFQKHVVALAHQVRLLPREHWPIQLDTHFSAGSISGDAAMVPVAERFFGGNVVGNFVNNPLWKMPAGPLIRSFPQNTLNALAGQPAGGDSFTALNFTAALPVWRIPAMPRVIRNAKPLADGIHLGVMAAQAESRKDYLARTPGFPPVLMRADAVFPDLTDARTRLERLAGRNDLPSDMVDQLNGLVAVIKDALEKLGKAKRATRSGIAWDACASLAGEDADSFALAHLRRELSETVAPALETANLAEDARALRELADKFEGHRQALAMLIDPLALTAMVDLKQLDALGPAVSGVATHAKGLKSAIDALGPRGQPIGTLAFTAAEWAAGVITLATPDPRADLSDRLNDMTKLTVGIGKLVPPQIDSTVAAAAELSTALKNGGETDAAQAIDDASVLLRQDLPSLVAQVKAIQIPAAERWAREQNTYFTRALDVAFREMTLTGVRFVGAVDVARLRSDTSEIGTRYGLGAGVQFNIVTFQVTMGYSFNPDRRESESLGAFFFLMEVADLFR
jgi:hypothetical protein